MSGDGVHRTSLVAGLLFVALGTAFLLEALDVLTLRATYVWPVVLIVVGMAVLWSGLSSSRRGDDDRDRPQT